MEQVGACKRRKTEDDGWNKDVLGKNRVGGGLDLEQKQRSTNGRKRRDFLGRA